jgi:hypothetical protein
MRYEFHDNGTMVGAVQWEGPGQVDFDVPDPERRESFVRYFEGEMTYLSSPFETDEEALQTRRRDWTPWEFERACRVFGKVNGYRAERTPSGPVEARAVAN